jgi:hypothetical protein
MAEYWPNIYIVTKRKNTMGNTHWTDYVFLVFFVSSAGCLAFIQLRKMSKFGYFKAPFQELDGFDIRILKLAGILLAIALILQVVKLVIE